jgi:hypothetical protein
MLWFFVAGFTAVFLAHTAPFPFLLERFAPSRSVWHVPRDAGELARRLARRATSLWCTTVTISTRRPIVDTRSRRRGS